MKRLLLLLAALTTSPLSAAYTYFYEDGFGSIITTRWNQNGVVTPNPGLSSSSHGSLIYKTAIPDGTAEYEIKYHVRIGASSGGRYIGYLRADQTAMMTTTGAQGNFYAVELANPIRHASGACTATVNLWKSVAGSLTLLRSNSIVCKTDMIVRAVSRTDRISVDVNGFFAAYAVEPLSGTGQPGVGVVGTPAGSLLTVAAIGPADRIPPNPVTRESIGATTFPNSVHLRWTPPADDPNGTGVLRYDIYRNGQPARGFHPAGYVDDSVSPGTTYTYSIVSIDHHYNYAAWASFVVTTPPAGAIDPIRTGVRPTGVYWGSLGEQIDMRSGNLNFTLPLLTAKGRGGWSVPIALSYNSQLWRMDAGGIWKLGVDNGHGFGFRLQAGAITPYYSDQWQVHHYKYYDATGAEYRLDKYDAATGTWADREGVYVTYDPVTQRLRFNDGSWWYMGSVAQGEEEDAGTYYPTLMQDSNGNQLS